MHPDTPLLTIVPLDYLWIEANFLENELTSVQPGQPAEITVDIYGANTVYHDEVLGIGRHRQRFQPAAAGKRDRQLYIHITECVPVRISLDAEELKAHPLRPGLSVFARIDTGRPGRSMLEPYAATPPATCRTGVYDTRLDGVDALIDSIVQKNRLPAAAST